ncbi:MAG: C2 family cysteine protease [Roseiarcus sp.]
MAIVIASSDDDWINSLTDADITADVESAAAGGALTYADAVGILTQVASDVGSQGTVTTAEFEDLQTIAANLNVGLAVSDYVADEFIQLVDGNPWNATWTGGSTKSTPLGNLQVGTTKAQLTELVGKWFLGADLPDPNPPPPPRENASYETFTTPLYGSTGAPVLNDIAQGDDGDCELMASLEEMVVNSPRSIESMIVNDGGGDYGVRFYVGGDEMWVTVNSALPVYDGSLVYNNAYNSNNPALWADLVEKAYAQLSATGLIGHPAGVVGQTPADSYANINGNDADDVLPDLTNCASVNYYNYNDANWTTCDKQVIIEAIAAGDDVLLETGTNFTYTYDSSHKIELVDDHAFAMIGYDSTRGDFIVRNPWGNQGPGQTYDITFDVSMNDIAGVEGDVAIANSAGSDVEILTAPEGWQSSSVYANPEEAVAGDPVSVASLFSVIDTAGLPITQYLVQVLGSGTIELNGATDLATSAQTALGEIVVSAGDLSKLAYVAGSSAGAATNLEVAAYDGATWSPLTDISLTIAGNPVAVTPRIDAVVAASGTISVASLFTTIGSMGSSSGDYQISATGAGVINLNGAYNWGTTSDVDVASSELPLLTYTAPSTPGAVTLQVWAYNGSARSDPQDVQLLVGASAAQAIQNYDDGELSGAVAVADSAANVFANLDGLQTMLSAGVLQAVTLTDATPQTETISQAQYNDDAGVLSILSGEAVSYTIAASLTIASAGGLTSQPAQTISGAINSADAGLTVSIYDGATLLGTATPASNGDWSASVTLLPTQGPQAITAQATDAADNVVTSNTVTYTLVGPVIAVAELQTYASQINASAGFQVAVSDSASNVQAGLALLTAEVGHITSITLTDGGTPTLTLTTTQALNDTTALGEITSAYVLDVSDAATAIEALTPTQIASLETNGVAAIAATGGPVALSVAQAAALETAGLAVTASSVTLSDTAANIEKLTTPEINGLDGIDVTAITATGASVILSVAQAAALETAKLVVSAPAGKTVTLSDTAANIENNLSAGDIAGLKAIGVTAISATASVTLSVAQAAALEAAGLKASAPAGKTVTLSDTATDVETELSASDIAGLVAIGVTALAASDLSVTLTVAQAAALEAAKLKVTAPSRDTVTLSDTAADIETELTASDIAGLKAIGVTALTSNASTTLTIAQAVALQGAGLTLSVSTGTATLADTAADVGALTATQIAALKAMKFVAITATDASVTLTVAQAIALEAAGIKVSATTGTVTLSDTAAAIEKLTTSEIAGLKAIGVTGITAGASVTLTVAQAIALENASLAVSATAGAATLSDTAADIEKLTAGQIAGLVGVGVMAIAATDTSVLLSVAQAAALEAATLKVSVLAGKTVTLSETAAAIEALTSSRISALAAIGVTAVAATDASVLLSVAEAAELEGAGIRVGAPSGKTVTLSDAASNIESLLTTGEIADLKAIGVSGVAASDASVTLSVAQAQALETAGLKVSAPTGKTVTLADAAANIEANLTASEIAGLKAIGVSGVAANDASVALSLAQAAALETAGLKASAPSGETVTLSDTAANIEKLTTTEIAGLKAIGVTAITTTDAAVLLTVAQALALEAAALKVSAFSGDAVTLSDTAAHIEALTAGQIALLPAIDVTAIAARDASVSLSVAQVAALETAGLQVSVPTGDSVTLSDTTANFKTLTGTEIEGLAGVGVTAIKSPAVNVAQTTALEATAFKVSAPSGNAVTLSDTAAQIDGLSAPAIAGLKAIGVTAIAATDASVALSVAEAAELEGAALKVSAPSSGSQESRRRTRPWC